MRTASHQDIVGVIDLPNYENYEETDGGGIISYKAYRNFIIRAGEWNENEEKQYRYDVAWEKRDKGLTLSAAEMSLLKEPNPAIKSAYTSLKPIVSGAKLGYTYNNIVLDKYALYPLSYRVMKELNPESNAVKLYNKMQRENIDYIVFESGRKVGAENSHATYVDPAQQVKEGVSEVFNENKELIDNYVNKDLNILPISISEFNKLSKLLQQDLEGYLDFNSPEEGLFESTGSFIIQYDGGFNLYKNLPYKYQSLDKVELRKYQVSSDLSLNDLRTFIGLTYEPYENKLNQEITPQQTGEGVAVFNDAEYESVVDVPFAIMSLQSDVPSKEVALVTRGSQTTKLITMDYMDNGVPFDYTGGLEKWMKLSQQERINSSLIYKEIANNQRLLEEMTNEGYQMMLKRLGITEEDGNFIVTDFSEAAKTLRDEVFKRETNDNISDAIAAFSDGETVLEATPAYQQVRNILYSIVDKQIVRPKISGGQKVQIPSSLFESNRVAQTEINGKKGYTSDILKFYENKDGERVMEIMVGRWFQSDMSDEELLDYLNNTEEGQKILSGLAFRIPTQKQNSIDAFRIKQFLPKEFGDNVVVPAAIVKKVGSDFDIDKLSIYLKNVFYEDGKLKLVPFYGFGQQAKDKFAAMFDSGKLFNKEQRNQLKQLQELKDYELSGMLDTAEGERFNALFEALGVSQDEDALSILVEELKKDGVRDAVVNRMYKQSLENEFIQSSENLVTHPANFERLITPNSAEQLKDISKTIVERVVGKEFDYTDVDNMLDRRFMSRLRQAFVSGKQAIGIAAVNQTNHSLNQRSAMYIDKNRLDRVAYEDAYFLGDAEVRFEEYNKVTIDGQEYPSLSGVNNSERSKKFPNGQLISDILGQFIDGYVDISKGPWIMEMGATPNVASTFMFLVKIGVPVDTVAYFMNQPIIRDYLQSVENAGYKFLFIDDFINATIDEYGGLTEAQEKNLPKQIPSKASLLNTLDKKVLKTAQDNLEQIFMLKEFLKYAKMANQLYTVTQGTNWDTSTFNDPYLVFKKNVQFAQAQNTIISDAGNLLESSFIGNQADKINDSRNALANFLLSDRGNVRTVLEQVLRPYVGLPNRTFIKVARKAVNDLFDWAVQTNQGLNLQIQETLLSDKGVASEVVEFIDKVKKNPNDPLFNNQIVNLLEVRPSKKGGETTPNNVSLKNTDNKVYDQNNIIYSFRELREALQDKTDLYDKLVTLAILQSGLNNSPISFTSLIPYEDFARVYNKTLPIIENLPNLNDFYELGVFQRNNWSDDDVVAYTRLFSIFSEVYGVQYPSVDFLPPNVKKAIANDEIPQVITQKIGKVGDEYIVASWNKKLSRQEIARMRKAGDYSYINKGLFKQVFDADGDPLITTDKKKNQYFVYKAINALGDSFRANEFYASAKQSIIDNGMMKVSNEVMDAQVVAAFEQTKPTPSTSPSSNILFTKEKGKYRLADGQLYDADQINAEMLLAMGYSEQRAGQIINIKCKG
jgi:hypothetical protein